jgi:aryl-alcohol dehydrogenase-like predicted oxidoreductase
MQMESRSKLGLGGHSFIEQLGNDPKASFEEQCDIVASCLDNGICLIDTTYYQERIALGAILNKLQRREEARIMAWNFFHEPGKESELAGFTPYESHHVDIMLKELQSEYVDILVIHAHNDKNKLQQELQLASQWKDEGKVKQIALGMVRLEHLELLPDSTPISYILAPYNVFNQKAAVVFAKARERGFKICALSPFVRGWKLREVADDAEHAADLLLRWVATQNEVDHVIVSMRKREWVKANLESMARGPLNSEELMKLNKFREVNP